jgi:hypothetical protein
MVLMSLLEQRREDDGSGGVSGCRSIMPRVTAGRCCRQMLLTIRIVGWVIRSEQHGFIRCCACKEEPVKSDAWSAE